MDFSNIKELYIPEGKVKSITFPDGSSYTFNEESYHDYSLDYFTIESLEDNNEIRLRSGGDLPQIHYSKNNGSWTNIGISINTTGTLISTLNTGDTLRFKYYTQNPLYAIKFSTSSSKYTYFKTTKKFKVYGNIMSLLWVGETGTYGFKDKVEIPCNYCFYGLFYLCTNLVSAKNLVLPATTLKNYCYSGMFTGCINLEDVPSILPATTLTEGCYYNMMSCGYYDSSTGKDMYNEKLTKAPILPALTLVTNCYQRMFQSLKALNWVKMMATDISATNCLYYWIRQAPSDGTFIKNINAQWDVSGYSGIPTGWTVQTAAA